MAMTIPGMASAIEMAFASFTPATPATSVQQLSLALATAIVVYIQANAVVPALGLAAPPGGGPVTGQATVT